METWTKILHGCYTIINLCFTDKITLTKVEYFFKIQDLSLFHIK
jgi:hypothetical protein